MNWFLFLQWRITGQIDYVGGKSPHYIQSDTSPALFAIWKFNARLQIGKICFLWRSDPAQVQVLKTWSTAFLQAARTGRISISQRVCLPIGEGQIDSTCIHLVWNKSGLTLDVPANLQPVWYFFFKRNIHHTVFSCQWKIPHTEINMVS